VRFNEYARLKKTELIEWLRFFRSGFEKTKDVQVDITDCHLEVHNCSVHGVYSATFIAAGNEKKKSGNWLVEFSFEKKTKSWKISNIQIENIAK